MSTAIPLPAQGGIRWSDNTLRPVVRARELASSPDWELRFPGWTTTSSAPFGPGNQSTAIGIVGTTRSVSVDMRSEGTSNVMQPILFDFVRNPNVEPIYRSACPACMWTGYLASPIGGAVPSYAQGALCHRIQLLGSWPRPPALFTLLAANTWVGVALTDTSGNLTGNLFVVRPIEIRAAGIVDYRFDRGAGSTAINYFGIAGGAATEGQLTPGGASSWTTGQSGSALARGSSCDTGWAGDLGGSFSVGWFMRGPAPSNLASPIFALGTFRCFTGDQAMHGLRCAMWGGTPTALDLSIDVQALAATRWVHVALVVNADVGQATWYIDGTAQPSIAITGRTSIAASASSTMLVGAFTGGMTGRYDIDEFRMINAPVPASDILAWATGSPATTTSYSATCGANLRAMSAPNLGNANFRLRIEGAPGAIVALTLGASPRLYGTIDLPIDLALLNLGFPSCLWYSDFTISIPSALPGNGLSDVPLPIPFDLALRGLDLDAQAVVIEVPSLAMRATNAQILAID